MKKAVIEKQISNYITILEGMKSIKNILPSLEGKTYTKRILTKMQDKLKSEGFYGLTVFSGEIWEDVVEITIYNNDRCVEFDNGICEYTRDNERYIYIRISKGKKIDAQATINNFDNIIKGLEEDVMLLQDNLAHYEELKKEKEELKKVIDKYNSKIHVLINELKLK